MTRPFSARRPQPIPEPLLIEDVVEPGVGLARADGKAVFVSGALVAERVQAQRTHRHRGHDEAEVTAVLAPAPQRVTPRCAVYGICGGCATQHQAPAAQRADKERVLLAKLERIGGVSPQEVLPALAGEPWHYRARARLGVRHVPRRGGAVVGFRERRSNRLTAMDDCPVLDARLGALIAPLRALIPDLAAAARIPQVEAVATDGEVALTLRHLDPLGEADRAALRAFAVRHGVRLFLQPGGPQSAHPLPPESDRPLRYALPGFELEFAFGPLDFTQVNLSLNAALVQRAVALADPQPGMRVGDLFCGVGNFALALARRGARVTGLEADAALVARARENARTNGLRAQAEFRVAELHDDAGGALAALGPVRCLLLDPPRAGAREVCMALPRRGVERIVYVSCNPATLARDAGILVHTQGFALRAAGVVDMFPHTAHVEAIALFERAAR